MHITSMPITEATEKASLFIIKRKGTILANTDNAIYGASNLYEKHSKKYGESPIGILAARAVFVIFSPFITYTSTTLETAIKKAAINWVSGDISFICISACIKTARKLDICLLQ